MNQPLSKIATRIDAIQNRERVLEAAIAVFNSRGLEVPLEEIAEAANVGVGTIYRHFPNKHALFEAVVRQSMQLLVDAADEFTQTERSDMALRSFILFIAQKAKLKRSIISILAAAGENVADNLKDVSQEFEVKLSSLVTKAQQDGFIRSDLTTADIRALLSGCMWAGGSTSAPVDVDKLINIVFDGMRAGLNK